MDGSSHPHIHYAGDYCQAYSAPASLHIVIIWDSVKDATFKCLAQVTNDECGKC